MRQQVVGVAAKEATLPGHDQEIFQRRESDVAPHRFAVERLRQRPARIDPAHGAQAALGFGSKPAVLKIHIRGQRRLDALEKHKVVRRATCRSAGHANALHHLRVLRRPLVGLHATHGPAIHKLQRFNTKDVAQQLVLNRNIVECCEVWITALVVRGSGV